MASIKYRIYKNNSSAGKKDKYYARAYHDETISLEELAEHMSNHNTPYSKGTIHGVLKDMVACVRELLLDSKKVKLDNLAIFSLGLTSRAADSPAQFTPSANIVKAYINAIGTGEISKKQLDISARFKEVDEYNRGNTGQYSPTDGEEEEYTGETAGPKGTYTLTAIPDNAEHGDVIGGGSYEPGSKVTISAFSKPGWLFDEWSDGNTASSRTIDVTGNITLTAIFRSNP